MPKELPKTATLRCVWRFQTEIFPCCQDLVALGIIVALYSDAVAWNNDNKALRVARSSLTAVFQITGTQVVTDTVRPRADRAQLNSDPILVLRTVTLQKRRSSSDVTSISF